MKNREFVEEEHSILKTRERNELEIMLTAETSSSTAGYLGKIKRRLSPEEISVPGWKSVHSDSSLFYNILESLRMKAF